MPPASLRPPKEGCTTAVRVSMGVRNGRRGLVCRSGPPPRAPPRACHSSRLSSCSTSSSSASLQPAVAPHLPGGDCFGGGCGSKVWTHTPAPRLPQPPDPVRPAPPHSEVATKPEQNPAGRVPAVRGGCPGGSRGWRSATAPCRRPAPPPVAEAPRPSSLIYHRRWATAPLEGAPEENSAEVRLQRLPESGHAVRCGNVPDNLLSQHTKYLIHCMKFQVLGHGYEITTKQCEGISLVRSMAELNCDRRFGHAHLFREVGDQVAANVINQWAPSRLGLTAACHAPCHTQGSGA